MRRWVYIQLGRYTVTHRAVSIDGAPPSVTFCGRNRRPTWSSLPAQPVAGPRRCGTCMRPEDATPLEGWLARQNKGVS